MWYLIANNNIMPADDGHASNAGFLGGGGDYFFGILDWVWGGVLLEKKVSGLIVKSQKGNEATRGKVR